MNTTHSKKTHLLSVIIPAWNETALEGILKKNFSNATATKEYAFEVIISTNTNSARYKKSLLKKSDLCKDIRVINNPGSRASAMNKGAKIAKGSMLLFLHADTILPRQWNELIFEALQEHKGGAFQKKFESQSVLLRINEIKCNFFSRFGYYLGDNAIFVRKETFDAIGGFLDQELMEDIDFSKKLRKEGSLFLINNYVYTSARRFEKKVFRTLCLMAWLQIQYFFGVDTKKLKKKYE